MQNVGDQFDRAADDRDENAAPPPDTPRSRRGDQTRERILDAAEDVFGRRGYHGASIVEITRQAGVGLGTFYVHFPSKIDIFRHLLRSRQAEFIVAARRAAEGAPDQRGVVQSAFRAYFEWFRERPTIMRMFREAEFIDPTLIADLYQEPSKEYAERLRRAMELGLIRKTDPEVLAWCLMGMAEFATLRWIVWADAGGLDDERYEAFVEIFALALGVGPQDDTPP